MSGTGRVSDTPWPFPRSPARFVPPRLGPPRIVRQGAASAGFTLFEVMVALAIMALIAGIGFPALQRVLFHASIGEAQDAVLLALAQARAEARGHDTVVTLVLTSDRRGLDSGNQRPVTELPDDVDLMLPSQGLAFFPDGSAHGGVAILTSGSSSRRIGVDPNTSRIGVLP